MLTARIASQKGNFIFIDFQETRSVVKLGLNSLEKISFLKVRNKNRQSNIVRSNNNLKFLLFAASSTICEVHFTKDCFLEKKDRVHLKKDAVPTIFFHNSTSGVKRFQLEFDSTNCRYNQETVEILSEIIYQKDEEETILTKKQQRCDELKTLCRFCFTPETDDAKNCVDISKLQSYNLTINDVNQLLGVSAMFEDNSSSELICESCFLSIVEFDAFRKKCREAQNDIWMELQDFEEKLEELRKIKDCDIEIYKNGDDVEVSNIEVLEEHLEETQLVISYNDEYEDAQIIDKSESIDNIPEGFQIIYQQFPDTSVLDGTDELDQCQTFNVEVIKRKQKIGELLAPIHGVDEYTATTEEIIKNPERNRFCFKIYECFFCKLKFAGRKTYIAHKCKVSEVQCEQCDKVFNRIQAYNSHVAHVHGSLPISKNFCPLCKTVIYSTLNQFKQHKRSCNKETKNQPIQCEICSKVCNNLKGYSIHKIFHETRNYTTSKGEKIVSEGLNPSKRVSICELCGKNFQSTVGYRMHKRNVHRVGQTEANYACKLCTKTCPTKRSLFDHMRNTHRVQESACNICGKVYRTRILLKKHL